MGHPISHDDSFVSVAPSVEVKSESAPVETAGIRHFALLITAVYFVIALIGILNHEMWRDEFQIWLIARNSHGLIQFFKNCEYEFHPLLWNFLLYVLTCFTTSLIAMQLLHLSIATTVVYLFNRYGNFLIFEKVLFSFGYYALFE